MNRIKFQPHLQREKFEVLVNPSIGGRDQARLVLELDGEHDAAEKDAIERADKISDAAADENE